MIFGRVGGGVSFQSLLYTLVTTWCINNQFQGFADNSISCNTLSQHVLFKGLQEALASSRRKQKRRKTGRTAKSIYIQAVEIITVTFPFIPFSQRTWFPPSSKYSILLNATLGTLLQKRTYSKGSDFSLSLFFFPFFCSQEWDLKWKMIKRCQYYWKDDVTKYTF